MPKFTLVYKILFLIIIIYFIVFGNYSYIYVGGGFSPPTYSSLLLINLINSKPISVKKIGLNIEIPGREIAIITHNLIETKDGDIYLGGLFYLIKKLPENGLKKEDAIKIVYEKKKKRAKNIFLTYLYFFDRYSQFEDWWWVVRTEDNSIYFINYKNGELYEAHEIFY